MLISCLAGCGKNSDGSDSSERSDPSAAGGNTAGDNTGGSGQEEGTNGSEDTADSDNPYAGIDISKPVEITMYVLGGSEPTDKDKVVAAINEKLKEKVNAQLNLQVIPLSEYATRYPLILSGGESVDLIYAAALVNFRENVGRNARGSL